MVSDARRCDDFHVHIEPITIGGESWWSYTFPTEPSWWVDDRMAEHRAALVRGFRFEELGDLVTELKQLIGHPLRLARRPERTKDAEEANRDDAAQLVRRCLSLSWLANLALEHLNGSSDFDPVERLLRFNEIRAAQLLAETGWALLTDLPRPLMVAGIIEAVARPNELHEGGD